MLDQFYETIEKDDLLQYGILGMHWGVRRSTEQLQRARGKKKWEEDGGGHVPLGEVTSKGAASAAKSRAKFDKIAAKNVKALSDAFGPSSREKNVANLIIEQIGQDANVTIDRVGNVVAEIPMLLETRNII